MSEERPQHPQEEPAEGAVEAEGAPGVERAKNVGGTRADGTEKNCVEHPREPAEGAEKALGAKRAKGAD
jgi:hypothetical protein